MSTEEQELNAASKSQNTGKRKQHKSKNQKEKKRKQSDNESSRPKPRPNYFLGIRIANPIILGKFRAVQEQIKHQDKRLTKAVVPTCTSHITLAVFYLKDEADVVRAEALMKECIPKIVDIVNGKNFSITLEGIGNFRKEVLFANILPGEALSQISLIAEQLDSKLAEFIGSGQKTFKPHATIMKLSKMHNLRRLKLKKIDLSLYNEFTNMSFGAEEIQNIQLLAMLKKKQNDGYYHSECEININGSEEKLSNTGWALEKWAEEVSFCCITWALYTLPKDTVAFYCHGLANSIMQDACRSIKTQDSNFSSKSRLNKLKQTLRNDDVIKHIQEGMTSKTK
ncbi:A-kinase anchor protein 7-like isoform X1 [Clavelina lepadiformis]|uniref:A-kinase anchor protein 7-like isoform X1 n=1 Tax=Clavelina lepadiformis TaxID=159417 RepID=UPI0040425668